MASLLNNTLDISSDVIGTVLEIDKETREVAVFIPKFMPAIQGGNQYEIEVNTTNLSVDVLNLDYDKSIKLRNSLWTKPYWYDSPLPKVGTKVLVEFFEGDISQPLWKKFNPNGDFEVIDEEKYEKVASLQIGEKNLEIKKEDNIIIKLPEEMDVLASEDENKNKIYEIKSNKKYIISNEEPEAGEDGLLWYNKETSSIYIFKNGNFERMVPASELERIYDALSSILSKFTIASNFSKLPETRLYGDISVISSSFVEDEFYSYTTNSNILNENSLSNLFLKDNSFTYFPLLHKFIYNKNNIKTELIACQYRKFHNTNDEIKIIDCPNDLTEINTNTIKIEDNIISYSTDSGDTWTELVVCPAGLTNISDLLIKDDENNTSNLFYIAVSRSRWYPIILDRSSSLGLGIAASTSEDYSIGDITYATNDSKKVIDNLIKAGFAYDYLRSIVKEITEGE